LRIDSNSGNIFKFAEIGGCANSPHEILYDSLNARLNDTVRMECTNSAGYKCTDTSSVNLFGTIRKTKKFSYLWVDTYQYQTYMKGIGMVRVGGGGMTCTASDTLKGCVIDGIVYGDTTIVGLEIISVIVPQNFLLYQNYPNPFNPSTKIKFDVTEDGKGQKADVKLVIYDILGKEITILVNQQLQPGTYEVEWDGSNYPSGVYLYKLTTADFTETKRMVLIK
jgi:hypothetical protein